MTEQDIAIIGMSARLPGASSVAEYWENLCAGRETIQRFSADQLRAGGVDPAALADRRFVAAGGVIDGVEEFDAELFGMSRAEALISDPQHRLLLECAWEAMEDAGYPPRSPQLRTGVFAGSGRNTHLRRTQGDPQLRQVMGETNLIMSNDTYRLPTLLSYRLDLRGPSLFVQTACSTSLVAVHLASQALLAGECDLAIAGGVTVHLPQCSGYWYEEGGIESPDGHCRVFDAAAAGTVFGNGGGLVVLRRSADAIRDRDRVVAVIRGSAVNNDGSGKVGYTAPGVAGQVEVIREALAVAGVDARSIGYVEAHGTGTPLGDPIEVRALTEAYREDTADIGYCRIGSAKSNLGHLDAGAGIAGLIKAALMVQHGKIPPTLHVQEPNPELVLDKSPFQVATALADWPDGQPRRAAVSSFGLGGTNAHLVIEQPAARPVGPAGRQWQVLPWSAASPGAVRAMGARLAGDLAAAPDRPAALADRAHTLRVGRAPLRYRCAVTASGPRDAAEAIMADAPVMDTAATGRSGVVFLFPGQGAQRAGMAGELHRQEPVFREHLESVLGHLDPVRAEPLRQFLLVPDDQGVPTTMHAQSGLFAVEYALARLWEHWGVVPASMLGHSVGEYVAACLAGVLSLADAVRLVTRRGELMDGMPPGQMLAVSLSEPEVRELLATGKAASRVALAAVNGPSQCVLSGARADLARLRRRLDQRGVGYQELRTRHAFHSQHVEPILGPFREEVATTRLYRPAIPFGSGVTGTWITAEQASDPDYWARHAREPVRFADGLACVAGSAPAAYLEVGPGPVLASLARMQLADTVPVVSSMASRAGAEPVQAALVAAAGALWSAGVDLDWHRFDEPEQRARQPLPAYPFDRTDHSLPEPATAVAADRPAGGTPDRSGRPPAADVRRVVADQIGLMRRQLALLSRGATSDQEVSTP